MMFHSKSLIDSFSMVFVGFDLILNGGVKWVFLVVEVLHSLVPLLVAQHFL